MKILAKKRLPFIWAALINDKFISDNQEKEKGLPNKWKQPSLNRIF